jgi:hypothetical protein
MVTVSEERISPAVLGISVFDPESWDVSQTDVGISSAPGAGIGTGRIDIFLHDLLGVGSVSLRIDLADEAPGLPHVRLPGRVLLGSGALWIDEHESGSHRSGATVPPGVYGVSVLIPESDRGEQRYTLTLFGHEPIS